MKTKIGKIRRCAHPLQYFDEIDGCRICNSVRCNLSKKQKLDRAAARMRAKYRGPRGGVRTEFWERKSA